MTTSRLARLTAGVAGATAVITALTLLARVTGFVRWFAFNGWVGPNEVGTAYTTANTIPNVLFEVAAGGALAGAVVPLLAAPLARSIRAEVDQIASALLGWAMAALIPLAVLTWLASPLLVRALLGPSAAVDQAELATSLLRIFAWQIPLYGLGVVASGVLQAHRRFIGPALAPLASSVVVMVSYWAFAQSTPGGVSTDLSDASLAWLGWGTTAGVAALSLPLLIPMARAGVRLRPTLRFPAGVAGRARALALAGAGGLLAQQVSVLVTVRLANAYGGAGAVNVYQYANAVVLLPYAVLAVPLATALFPQLADLAATGRHRELATRTAQSTRALIVVAACGAAALVAAAWQVEAVFGAFARDGDVVGMAGAIIAAAPSVVGLGLMYHLARVLFALERGRFAMVGTSVGWGTTALLAWIFAATSVAGSGAVGALRALGLASAIGSLIGAAVLAWAVVRLLGGSALAGVGRTAASALLGAGLGAGGGLALAGLLPGESTLGAVLVGVAAGVVAAGITAGTVALLDRSSVQALRRRRGEQEAEPDRAQTETTGEDR